MYGIIVSSGKGEAWESRRRCEGGAAEEGISEASSRKAGFRRASSALERFVEVLRRRRRGGRRRCIVVLVRGANKGAGGGAGGIKFGQVRG